MAIVRDIDGRGYEIKPGDRPGPGSAFTSITLTFEYVMHPDFFTWFFDDVAPRIVFPSPTYPKEHP
jgi:hypothetical protein